MDKLIVDNLFLSYGANPILKGVSFELKAGEVVCLLGASGSGKTTLLRAVAGLEQPSDSRITLDKQVFFDGAAKIDCPVEQRSLGLVFQSYALWPHRTVAENVGYGLKLRKVSGIERKRRVQAALDQLGLGHLAERFPYQLSGGQQKRVSLLIATIHRPPMVLLDEPTAALDAKSELEVFERFAELTAGKMALLISHRFSTVKMADRIVVLEGGRLVEEGTHQQLMSLGGRYAAMFEMQAASYR